MQRDFEVETNWSSRSAPTRLPGRAIELETTASIGSRYRRPNLKPLWERQLPC
ncbi:hypothetical protein BLA17378_01961 [Burkholderia aenigmatica]|uniref:Uncharacterized protein n=1 Tax=Burkholderia aenigmatica TaxID=2015348 RepID=A0ABY6XSW3_9BURK|nr:hypothetical protein BLA17378_01961 [Burkholderia aenigmatica]